MGAVGFPAAGLGGVSVVSRWCSQWCSRWCLGGVSVVSPWCLRGVSVVSVVSRWCLGCLQLVSLVGVSVVSQWCLSGVSVLSRWCLGGVWDVSWWCAAGVLAMSWWCVCDVLVVSRWRLKGVCIALCSFDGVSLVPSWCPGGASVVSQPLPCWYKVFTVFWSYLGGVVLVVSGRLRWWSLVVCLWCFPARHQNLISSMFSWLVAHVAPCTR